jgi:hypothetical protein
VRALISTLSLFSCLFSPRTSTGADSVVAYHSSVSDAFTMAKFYSSASSAPIAEPPAAPAPSKGVCVCVCV